ncbi:MAG: class II fructose-bisphosphate aldolase family protein [Planctomycetes bacterium]|nr:class II fructose-bisphosphate aldolase family protein [Planctomycetota bacterium]
MNKDSEEKGYAVGAFNDKNLETLLGVARAAVLAKSPAIIQVSEGAIKYMGLKPVTHIVSTVAKNIAAPVPIALHLDHGRSFDSVFGCIKAGFTSVHIDASNLPLDENISLTKQVVEIARGKGVWVQGEVGAIVGGHGEIGSRIDDIPIAKLNEVIRFVSETNVDTIAAAIGTAHGVYKNEDIIFDLLKDIKKGTNKPFVLHGGSGVDPAKIKKAIQLGVNIINIGTDIKVAFCRTLIDVCLKNQTEMDPRNLLKPTIGAVEQTVAQLMKLFGSAGQVAVQEIET